MNPGAMIIFPREPRLLPYGFSHSCWNLPSSWNLIFLRRLISTGLRDWQAISFGLNFHLTRLSCGFPLSLDPILTRFIFLLRKPPKIQPFYSLLISTMKKTKKINQIHNEVTYLKNLSSLKTVL